MGPDEHKFRLRDVMSDVTKIRIKYSIIEVQQQWENIQRKCFIMYNSPKLCNIDISAGNYDKVNVADPFLGDTIKPVMYMMVSDDTAKPARLK